MRTITVDKGFAEWLNAVLAEGELDFEAFDVEEDSTLYDNAVKFDDGVVAEVKVCTGQSNAWAECVWFDKNGDEIACADPEFEFEGVWECPLGEQYNVEVMSK